MSDVGRDNISLLDSGGGQENLIPVQGGGGGGENISLLSDETDLEQLVPVQGGGNPDLEEAIADENQNALYSAEAALDPVGTMFSAMTPLDQFEALRTTAATQVIADSIGLDDEQTAEIIVNSTLARAKNSIRNKYGLKEYDVDYATQSAIDNGTPGEQQTAREALASYDGTGKPHDQQDKEKADLIRTSLNNYKKINNATIIRRYSNKIEAKVIEYITPLKENINLLKGVDIHREEFTLAMSDDNKFKLTINIDSWIDNLSIKITKYFPDVVNNFIKIHENYWNHVIIKTNNKMNLPILYEKDLQPVFSKISSNNFDETKNYGRYIAVLPYNIQQFIVIPPINGSIQNFRNVLLTLQMLNLIKYNYSSDKKSWKIAKNTIIVFSHPFYEYKNSNTRRETNRKLFTYMNELEIENKQHIFCLSDGGSAELSLVGFSDICNLDNKNPIKHIKSKNDKRYFIPTLMTPTHILFPYQLNTMNGLLISGERETGVKNIDLNIFNNIYKGPSYGNYEGRFIRYGYPLTNFNSNICSVRMDASLLNFIKETTAEGNITNTIQPIIDEIVKQGVDKNKVTDVLSKYANKNKQSDRGKFIIEIEALIKIKRAAPEIIKEITTENLIQNKIHSIIANYHLPEYKKYLRYPFTGEVFYIKNKMNNDLQEKNITPSLKLQSGGNREECKKLRVPERTKTLSIFDKENYITDNILIFHVKRGYKPESCPPPIKLELQSSKYTRFEEHTVEQEIANRYSTQLITLGGKIFEIREIDDDINVIKNWQGKPSEHVNLPVPILIKGEADLLNSLQITPQNMGDIFYPGNSYGLENWKIAIPEFLKNLVMTKCYKNTLLLTNSECQSSRNFLYSIRQYIDKEIIADDTDDSYDTDDTDSTDNSLVKDESSSDSDEDSDEDIVNESSIKVMENTIKREPTFMMNEVNNIWQASVKLIAFHKQTGKTKTLSLHLNEPNNGNDGSTPPTQEQKDALKTKIEELKAKYPKYIIHTY